MVASHCTQQGIVRPDQRRSSRIPIADHPAWGKGLSCFSLICHLECLDEFLPHFALHRSSIQSVPLKDVSLQPALVSGLVADHGAESIHCPAAILRAQRISELLILGGGHTNSRNRRSSRLFQSQEPPSGLQSNPYMPAVPILCAFSG